MKYIRTKDTIFEVVEETEIIYRVKAKGNPNNIYSKSKCQTNVIKESNTIEELCDEFIAIDIGVFGDKIKFYKTIKEVNEDKTFLYDKLYGAIWTEWGLKYVAKMNEKGELELL